ncbi:hypothetical protein SAY87_009698 [Trapa incisa]|uniref:Trichome birefringence-like N-terminal domain-containing protein n=1 Tax=Trapa incisa TaxID=236973 RepID=A0AAN7PY26_9MYRT|nr:hypothetical protein SAY87_009698 [Trapa incisa]
MRASFHRLSGKQIYLALLLVTLVFTAIHFLVWENNPIQSSWLQVLSGIQRTALVKNSEEFQAPKMRATDVPAVSAKEKNVNKTENERSTLSPPVDIPEPVPNIVNIVPNSRTSLPHGADSVHTSYHTNAPTTSPDGKMGGQYFAHSQKSVYALVPSTFDELGGERVDSDTAYVNTTWSGKHELKVKSAEKGQSCNYVEGKWVLDKRWPLYSGYGCKQWLSEMWACRLTKRMNFNYETLRWQPKSCQMETFEGQKFLKRMKDKTIAFVGDSLGRQQFQSLLCMVTGGIRRLDVKDVGKEYGLVKARHAIRPGGWAYRFPETNTTIIFYWSTSLCDLKPINRSNHSTEYAMHLDRPPSFLQRFIPGFDVLVLNTGHHWNRGKISANRWVMYVGGKPNTDRKISQIWHAKNLTIHSIVKWLDSQLPNHPRLKTFYRSVSPRHFVGGDWNTGGSCDNENPVAIGKEVSQTESSDHIANSAVRGTKVKLLDITGLSQVRDEGHISRFSKKSTQGTRDCLHWCLPGVPDTWNEILAALV